MIGSRISPAVDFRSSFCIRPAITTLCSESSEFELSKESYGTVPGIRVRHPGAAEIPLSKAHFNNTSIQLSITSNKKVQRDMELGRSLFLATATVQHGLGTFH
jgi:hypothetical protein